MMPRPGYYAFRHPDGRTLAIGRVPLAHAIAEVIAANQHLASLKPTLVERLTGADHSIAQLVAKMPMPDKPNTLKSLRSLDKLIRAKLDEIFPRHGIDPDDEIADLIGCRPGTVRTLIHRGLADLRAVIK